MLDRRTEIILRRIDELCSDGNYHIIEFEELVASLPYCDDLNDEALRDILKYLRDHDYVNIKYSDGGTYCVCPLPAGRIYLERTAQRRREYSAKYIYPFIPSFFGALVGAFIAALILIAVLNI